MKNIIYLHIYFRIFLFLKIILLIVIKANSQGLAINTTGAASDSSAMLDVSGTNKGVLINRMTTAQRNNIILPAEGLMIYNITTKCFEAFVNSSWNILSCPSPCNNSGGTITGDTNVCQGQNNVQYSVAINNGISYMWSYTGSGINISGTGDSVSLNFMNTATSGILTVIGTNTCGTVNGVFSASFPITVKALPNNPGNISGSATVCSGETNVNYSVANVPWATSYNWTVPSGAIITSGQGTTSITVDFGSNSGYVSVIPINNCGTSSTESLYITVNSSVSASPGNISGNITPLINTTYNYSISPVATATNYYWTITPSGAIINSGQGTTNVSVTFPSTSNTFSVCVYAINGCGNSSTQCLTVNVFSNKQEFVYTGNNQNFTVPNGITSIFVKMWGAGGAGGINYSGGSGAFVSGLLSVSSGSNLNIIVAGGGQKGPTLASAPGGFGGGGASGAGSNPNSWYAGSGGGRSAIQYPLGTDVVTAGGGGGCGVANGGGAAGGGGGAPDGGHGEVQGAWGGPGAGKGGTTTSGGIGSSATSPPAINSTNASFQNGSDGGSGVDAGGGGGGGYFGGSGGAGYNAANSPSNTIGGGGGGSSYTANLTSVVNIAGNNGHQTSTVPAPNNTDIDYTAGVGVGSYSNSSLKGGNGKVVIYW